MGQIVNLQEMSFVPQYTFLQPFYVILSMLTSSSLNFTVDEWIPANIGLVPRRGLGVCAGGWCCAAV